MTDMSGLLNDALAFGCTMFVGCSALIMIAVGKPRK